MPQEDYFKEQLIDLTGDTVLIPTRHYIDKFNGSVKALKFLMDGFDKAQVGNLYEVKCAMEEAVRKKFEEIIGHIHLGASIKSVFLKSDTPANDRHFGVRYEKCIIGGEGIVEEEISYEPYLDARIALAESIIEKKKGEPVKGPVIVARAYLYPKDRDAELITRCLLLSFPSDTKYGRPAVSKEYTGFYKGSLSVIPVSGVKKVLDTAKETYGVLTKDKTFEDVRKELDALDSNEKLSLDELMSQVRTSRQVINTLKALKRTV